MKNIKKRYQRISQIWIHTFAGVILMQPFEALAVCTGNTQLRTCNLQGSHTINYEASRKDVDFTLRSNSGGHAQPFAIKVEHASGGNFRLLSDSGEELEVNLTFSYRSRSSTPLYPGQFSQQFPGNLNDINSLLSVNVDPSSSITSSYYHGTFQMEVMQYLNTSSEISQTVNFDIELEVKPSIKIRNLGNIYINGSHFHPGQDIMGYEDFCVDGKGFSSYLVSLSSRNGISSDFKGTTMFQLSNPMDSLPYAASFTDDMNQTKSTRTLNSGHTRATLTNNHRPGACLTDNARLIVSIPAGSWEQARGSYYTDVLTVTVTSQ
ncbi:hypothetical protein [uncultured Microbulbifer sp.]|uniref:hypothetical protein n=1 Tax=uncultured Microbulbifer sp. TaxID=348147 RepID=UPI00262F953A|nr:hypothetical protein [uncultured Microbulbifer sp.]